MAKGVLIMWFTIIKRLTREQLLRETSVLRDIMRGNINPQRTTAERDKLYESMGWELKPAFVFSSGEYSEAIDDSPEIDFIWESIERHSHGNDMAKEFLQNFYKEEYGYSPTGFDKRLSDALSRFITLVTGIPRPKSAQEQRRLKEQEQQRIADSRKRPPPRKKGQRKKRNTNPKGGGGGRRGKQRDIDRSSRAYDKYKERKRND